MMGFQRRRKIWIKDSQEADTLKNILNSNNVDYEYGYELKKGYYLIIGKQNK